MSNYKSTLQSNNTALSSNNLDLQSLIDQANALPDAGGVELPELTNEGSASDLLSGKQLIDQDGNIVTGTIATNTSSNLTASGATVTVPAGYYATQATKSVTTATQATPTISVNSSGVITASATQSAGYVSAGTKSATKQLTTQAAQTITPGTTDKTIASGRYLTGTQTIKGDSNLVPANIVSGKSIFGVAGTATAGGGSGSSTVVDDVSRAIIEGTITEISDDEVETIGIYAFCSCSSLTTANFPAATTIGNNAFSACTSLTTVSFPAATTIGNNAFSACTSLTTVSFPAVTSMGSSAFARCYSLTTASFPSVTSIGSYAFSRCSSLTTASFPACITIGSGAFEGCAGLTTASFPACITIGSGAFDGCAGLTTVSFPAATTIGNNVFRYCTSLTTVSFPAVTSIGEHGFSNCTSLTTANFPAATTIGRYAFTSCTSLTTANFPAVTSIGSSAFSGCTSLTTASFPSVTSIGSYAFSRCSSLTTFVLAGLSLPTLYNSKVFAYTPMSTTGYFYVPRSLIASYQAATNWTYFSSRFSAVEDYADWDGIYGGGNTGGSSIIDFYIDGVKYQAEEGAIWSEWVESSYNTINAFVSGGYVIVMNLPIINVLPTDIISNNRSYETGDMSGGSDN